MNNIQKINVNDLRLVALKYYGGKNDVVDYNDALSYAFIIKKGDNYVNPFSPKDDYPLFEEIPYTNESGSNEKKYARKFRLVSGDDKSGPCYVSCCECLMDIFDSQFVTFDTLEKYILKSSLYFKDRSQIVMANLKKLPLFAFTINPDNEKRKNMNYYFAERGVELQKK